MQFFKRALPWLLAGLYILGIQYLLDWREVLVIWRRFPLSTLAVGAALIYLSYGVRSLRFYRYFAADYAISWLRLLRLTLHHNFLNTLLPARSGEISFPLLMKRYFGVPFSTAAPALLWLRLLDLHAVLTFGFAALLWRQRQTGGLIAFLLVWPALPWLAYAARGWLLRRAGSIPAVQRIWSAVAAGFPRSPAQFAWSWCLTWCNWLVKFLALTWMLATLSSLPWPTALPGVILGELSSILPVHAPAGVGSYEAGIIAGLTPFGVELARAGRAAINLHLFVLAVVSSSGLLALLLGWLERRPER